MTTTDSQPVRPFEEIVELALDRYGPPPDIARQECVEATRRFIARRRGEVLQRHRAGEAGINVVHMLSDLADEVLVGAFHFAMCAVPSGRSLARQVCLCALGGYGRRELNPHSDIDVSLLYDGPMTPIIEEVNAFLVSFLWDIGFKVGYGIRRVSETIALAREDLTVFTSLLESRAVLGDGTLFARQRLRVRELQASDLGAAFVRQKVRDRNEALSKETRDLYALEPDVKENAGGLRDFHTALWLLMMAYGVNTLDDASGQGLITPEEQLDFVDGLDFLWRVRNELHFTTGSAEDKLTFARQKHVARQFGYGEDGQHDIARFMQDYYAAAGKLRRFLRIAARLCHFPFQPPPVPERPDRADWIIKDSFLYAGGGNRRWFADNPARMMEVFWNCARNKVTLSRSTERLITENLHLAGDAFRSSDLVRRFFVALCSRPLQAGHALRQASRAGLLGRYIPEFSAVTGMIRYQNFHTYPVEEHTLRAIEALERIPEMEGPVGRALHEAIENLSGPHILVMAILFHDLGKAAGEVHVSESVRLARVICDRIGMPADDTGQILFLVQHHILMNHISQYRDIDDEHIVRSFCETVKTEQQLRALFLLSYADLSAVGPAVWNDWKGTLLMQLYLRSMKRLVGRAETVAEEYWRSGKADQIRALVPDALKDEVAGHLEGLGQRYFIAFSPEDIARHLGCIAEARTTGLAVRASENAAAHMSDVVISTQDRRGLFARIAGSFCSQLIDVHNAALFTRPDGWVVDVFTVRDAWQDRPLTAQQVVLVHNTLRAILFDARDVDTYVEQARRRLFALLQPRVAVQTRVDFDNDSSRQHTVIDIETGDRTGLLYDITKAMAGMGLDISTARIVTDARRVRDSFYVTRDSGKIIEETEQAAIRESVLSAIHPRTAVESEGVEA